MRIPILVAIAVTATSIQAADWPTWRGPDRDGISVETGLLKAWPETGPNKIWTSTEAGIGYSSFSITGERLYTMGADEEREYVVAINATDGKLIWMQEVGERLRNGWGDGPRSTPAVTGDLVVALGGKGRLCCVSASSGQQQWSVELTELGGRIPNWGYSESPLIDGERVLCTPGGNQGSIAAFDLASGKQLWQSTDVTEGAHYSSIVPVQHHGQKQYIQLTQNKVFGIDADGGLKWMADWPDGRTAVIPTPLYQDGKVYVTSGYGAGCMLLDVGANNNVEQVYANKFMKNHHGGVVKVGDYVYGYSDKVGWVCQDFASGELSWNEKNKLGKGAIAYADGQLYCLEEQSGTCVLIDASSEGWLERGRFTIDPQTEQRATKGKIWTHPVIANGKLYLRDQEIICCYDISN